MVTEILRFCENILSHTWKCRNAWLLQVYLKQASRCFSSRIPKYIYSILDIQILYFTTLLRYFLHPAYVAIHICSEYNLL